MDGYKEEEDIIVTPVIQNGQVKWQVEIEGTGKKGSHGNYPPLELKAGKGAKIEVKIDNPPGANFKFAKDANALWVSTGRSDPTRPSSVPDQIPVDKIKTKNHDTVLEFVDHNKGNPVDLYYTLNFIDANNQQSSTLDPIIRNTGGGPGGRMDFAWYAVGAVAVVALLAVLLRPLFRRHGVQAGRSDGS